MKTVIKHMLLRIGVEIISRDFSDITRGFQYLTVSVGRCTFESMTVTPSRRVKNTKPRFTPFTTIIFSVHLGLFRVRTRQPSWYSPWNRPLWILQSSEIWRRVVWYIEISISKEPSASVFVVKKKKYLFCRVQREVACAAWRGSCLLASPPPPPPPPPPPSRSFKPPKRKTF